MENTEKSGSKGCFFYGCLSVVIVALIIIAVGLYIGFKAKNYIMDFTDTQSLELATSVASPAESARVEEKVKVFMDSVKSGKEVSRITLTDDEVNTLIATHEDLSDFKGMVEVNFSDSRVSGQLSLPLTEFGLEGRYLNGAATFKVECREGLLLVTIDSLEVKGRSVPEAFMDELRKQNLVEDMYKDVESVEKVKRLKRVEVKDNKLFIEVMPEAEAAQLEIGPKP